MPPSGTSGSLPGQSVFRLRTTTSANLNPQRTPIKPKRSASTNKSIPQLTQVSHLPDATSGALPPPLPPSVEMAYRNKCIDLKRRMNEVEESNDAYRLRKLRLLRGIRKMRLQRAFLLEALAKRMKKTRRHGGILNGRHDYDNESEGSSGGPPTVCMHLPTDDSMFNPTVKLVTDTSQPQEKPLRTKRGHRRPSLPTLLPSPSPQQDQQRSSSTYMISPHPTHIPSDAAPQPQPQPQPASQRAYDPHSTFHLTNPTSNTPPIRPTIPYDSFALTAYPQYAAAPPTADQAAITAALQQAWHELGPAGQRPYEKAYEEKMREFQVERDEFRARNRVAARNAANAAAVATTAGANVNVNANGTGRGGGARGSGSGGEVRVLQQQGDGEREWERERDRDVDGRGLGVGAGAEDVEMDGAGPGPGAGGTTGTGGGGAGGFTAVNG
ncbi:hypothetical protein MMC16_004039 [Acarospora aff. strigata]|nr:hypothetical protein [Acarospora aff. strigata]